MKTAVSKRETDILWREWQSRSVEKDRRTATVMGSLALLIGLGLVVLIFVAII